MSATSAAIVANSVFSQKVRGGLFAPVIRGVGTWHDADERAQEGLCQTWATFLRHYESTGEFLADGALVAHCRRRSRSRRDSFVPRGRRGKWSLDVFDAIERCRELGTLTHEDTVPLSSAAAGTPEDNIDATEFVSALEPMDCDIVTGLLAGHTTRELAALTSTSSATVSRRVARLRRRFTQVTYG